MEWIESETKEGYYYTFIHENGEKYTSIMGLDPNQVNSPQAVEKFILNNYETFALAYWGLLFATFVYLAGTYIFIPLYLRLKRGLPIFEEQ